MSEAKKRKDPPEGSHPPGKRSKGKQWKTPRQNGGAGHQPRVIEAGDSGIWATCSMGKEGKTVAELRDCFQNYVSKLYGDPAADDDDASDEDDGDVEAQIKKEVEGIKKPTQAAAFEHIRVDTNCVLFFKTRAPIEPVEFVRRICEDAVADPGRKASRFVNRLTPMTLMGKATENGLEEVARQVLAPHFHDKDATSKKFAIRPNIRNNKVLTRKTVITKVASCVGHGHRVDLNDYDVLILVDVYKNVCGVSVVGHDFERLKRYNLAEIYEPTPKDAPAAQAGTDGGDGGDAENANAEDAPTKLAKTDQDDGGDAEKVGSEA